MRATLSWILLGILVLFVVGCGEGDGGKGDVQADTISSDLVADVQGEDLTDDVDEGADIDGSEEISLTCLDVECPENAECASETLECECVEGYVMDAGACVQEPECVEDADCADEDLCNGVELCLEGSCTPGTVVECPAPEGCVAAYSCESSTGTCQPQYAPSGASCGDGLSCNGIETCSPTGQCKSAQPIDCGPGGECVEPDGQCVCSSPYFSSQGECLPPVVLATFDDLELGEESFWNGSDGEGEITGFESGMLRFANDFDTESMWWSGFAYSNTTDTVDASYDNQYSAVTGSGEHSSNYAVGYSVTFGTTPRIEFSKSDTQMTLAGFFVTNTTLTYQSMLLGDDYAKAFGGLDGTDPDWLLLTVKGFNSAGESTGTKDFYLADFRFEQSEDDYIVSDWTFVDLRGLGDVHALEFEMSSSDAGEWGMNTPSYFALDTIVRHEAVAGFEDVGLNEDGLWIGSAGEGMAQSGNARFSNVYDPEYASWSGFSVTNWTDTETQGWDNQYSAVPGMGANDSTQYATGYYAGSWGAPPVVTPLSDALVLFDGVYVTNAVYPYLTFLNGDDFSKKFGGEDGTDPDWLLLIAEGLDAQGAVVSTSEFYLADYRFEDSADDYAVTNWTWWNLSELGGVHSVAFRMESSDAGEYGMNTPAYFCLDDLTLLGFATN